jgi:GT2 family glycosyltransferase
MNSRLLVIVLSYNGVDLTRGCLQSLERQTLRAFDILVVDNASEPGTVDALRSSHPNIRLIEAPTNVGYAGGNNIGLRMGLDQGADLFMLLNNDTVLDPACLERLLLAKESDSQIGALGPMVYTWDETDRISSAGGRIDWAHADAVNVGAGEMDAGQHRSRDVDFVNGCGLLVTRAAVDKIGLLDERYFMYWEETDWCARIRRHGFHIRFEADAYLRHKATIQSDELGPTALYYMTRNRLLFFSLNATGRRRMSALLHAVHGAWIGAGLEARRGRADRAEAIKMALQDSVFHRWGKTDRRLAGPKHGLIPAGSFKEPTRV